MTNEPDNNAQTLQMISDKLEFLKAESTKCSQLADEFLKELNNLEMALN